MSDEYDAFGRKKDEAGLGDLGWGSSGDPAASSTPAPEATPNAPTASAGPTVPEFRTIQTPSPGLSRPRRNPAIVLIQLAVLAGIGAAVYFAVVAGNDASDTARRAIDQFNQFGDGNGGGGGGKGGGDDTVPEQVKARDYFTAAGLRAGLKILAREEPGTIANFSFRRDRINVQVQRGGKNRIMTLYADAEAPDVSTVVAASVRPDSLTYEEINPTAPARLAKAANRRLGRSAADVEYFVVSKFSGQVQWGVYYDGGAHAAQGDSRGRYLRKIS